MPNGIHHTSDANEWNFREAPLRALDHMLKCFARSHHMKLDENYHNWPSRALRWGFGIKREIKIAAREDQASSYYVGVCATRRLLGRAYCKTALVKEVVSADSLEAEAESLLEEALQLVAGWSVRDIREAMNDSEVRR